MGRYGKYSDTEISRLLVAYDCSGLSVREFANKIKVPRSTLCRWLRDRAEDAIGKERKRRGPDYPRLEDQLHEWVTAQRVEGLDPTNQEIRNKALQLAEQDESIESDKFKASDGWVTSFKERRRLKSPGSRTKSKAKKDEEEESDSDEEDAPSRTIHWPQVLLFGDSHFQHAFSRTSIIGSLLAHEFQRRCDIVVRGFSGYNTRLAKMALDRFSADLDAEKIVSVVILFGSNDACVEGTPSHVPIAEYSANLTELVGKFVERGIKPEEIVIVSPPPADMDAWGAVCAKEGRPVSTRENSIVDRYALAGAIVAQTQGTKFVDLYRTMISSTRWKCYLSDGLHLNPEGSTLFFDKLRPMLAILLKEHDCLLPDWKTMNQFDPQSSFDLLDFLPICRRGAQPRESTSS